MIARGHGEVGAEWRARWRASCKTSTPPFEGVTTDWNINQVALTFWSSFYDNIFEHPERPPQRIIDNDDLLDKWVADKSKEMEDRARKNGMKAKGMTAHDHDEVIVFEDGEEYFEDDDEGDDVDD